MKLDVLLLRTRFLVVFGCFFLASSCLFAGGFCMVLYNCEVQADVSQFIKLKFSKVFYKILLLLFKCGCWNCTSPLAAG